MMKFNVKSLEDLDLLRSTFTEKELSQIKGGTEEDTRSNSWPWQISLKD